jgi:hypothetical protein
LDCPELRDRLIGKDEFKGDFFLTPALRDHLERNICGGVGIRVIIPVHLSGELIGAVVGLFFITARKKDISFALPFGTF